MQYCRVDLQSAWQPSECCIVIMAIMLRFPAGDELGMCRASLVAPEQSILSISITSIAATF